MEFTARSNAHTSDREGSLQLYSVRGLSDTRISFEFFTQSPMKETSGQPSGQNIPCRAAANPASHPQFVSHRGLFRWRCKTPWPAAYNHSNAKLALEMTTAVPIPALFHPAACSWTKAAAMSIASSAAALIRGLLQSLRPAPLVAHACQPDLLPPAPSLARWSWGQMVMGARLHGSASFGWYG